MANLADLPQLQGAYDKFAAEYRRVFDRELPGPSSCNTFSADYPKCYFACWQVSRDSPRLFLAYEEGPLNQYTWVRVNDGGLNQITWRDCQPVPYDALRLVAAYFAGPVRCGGGGQRKRRLVFE